MPQARRKRLRWIDLREHLTGYLFILPSVLILTVFGFFPIGYAAYMSSMQWRVRKGPFIGLANYQKALGDWSGALMFALGVGLMVLAYIIWNRAAKARSNLGLAVRTLAALILIGAGFVIASGWGRMLAAGDKDFLNSLPITLFYALGTVPLELVLALILAYILFQKIRGQEFFRMIYFLPYITPLVAAAVVFRTIFSPRESSLANTVLSYLGVSPLKWLFEPKPVSEVLFGVQLPGLWAGPSLGLVPLILPRILTFVG